MSGPFYDPEISVGEYVFDSPNTYAYSITGTTTVSVVPSASSLVLGAQTLEAVFQNPEISADTYTFDRVTPFFAITGTTTVTITPAADSITYVANPSIVGSVSISSVPNAGFLFQVPATNNYSITGATTVTITPAATSSELVRNYNIVGANDVNITFAAGFQVNKFIVANFTVSAVINSDTAFVAKSGELFEDPEVSPGVYTFDGAGQSFAYSISPTYVETRIVPTATSLVYAQPPVYSITADLTVNVTPDSPQVFYAAQEYSIAGVNSVAVVPDATLIFGDQSAGYVINGAVTVSFVITSNNEYEPDQTQAHIVQGDIPLTVTPAADLMALARNYNGVSIFTPTIVIDGTFSFFRNPLAEPIDTRFIHVSSVRKYAQLAPERRVSHV